MLIVSGDRNTYTSKVFYFCLGTASLLMSVNLFATFPSGAHSQASDRLDGSGPSRSLYDRPTPNRTNVNTIVDRGADL